MSLLNNILPSDKNILKTSDYDGFVLLKSNRNISLPHANTIAEKIKEKNLLQYFPIVVNEKMEVIDGQHRLAAAKMNNVPVYFTMCAGATINDVTMVNTANRNWTGNDFLHKYVVEGKEDYIYLQEFMDRFKLTLTTSLKIVSVGTYKDSRRDFLNGRMKIGDKQLGEKLATYLNKMMPYYDRPDLKDNSSFVGALRGMMTTYKNFKIEELYEKLTYYPEKIHLYGTVKLMSDQIEKIYNYNRRASNRLNIVFNDSKKRWVVIN